MNDLATNQTRQQTWDIYNLQEPSFLKDVNYYEEFNVNRLMYKERFQAKGIPYVFITTPMLNLSKENCNQDAFLSWLSVSDPSLLKMLCYGNSSDSLFSTNNPFIPLLSNTLINFDAKDTVTRTKEIGETFYGFKLTLPGSEIDSIVGDEISIRYRDLQGLPVLKLHKAWFDYHCKVRRGIFSPSSEAIEEGFVDYTSSIYYFLLDMDGETINYWCKLTGVAPINVPYSSLGSEMNTHDIIEYNQQYVYSDKEDMNPDALLDFNKLSNPKGKTINLSLNFKKNQDSYIDYETSTDKKLSEENPYLNSCMKKPYVVFSKRSTSLSNDGNIKLKLKFK